MIILLYNYFLNFINNSHNNYLYNNESLSYKNIFKNIFIKLDRFKLFFDKLC